MILKASTVEGHLGDACFFSALGNQSTDLRGRVCVAGRTLAQLATRDGEGWVVPAIEVEDAPRFRHRGFMLDVARHFFPVEVVTALIDRLSDLKLNVLHLHLSDDQGWRLAMATRPLLTERASATAALGDAGGFYTADDYRTIVAHATSRHMTVVPEIDMPGHTHAVGLAYPELVEHPVITDEVMAKVSNDKLFRNFSN